MLVSCDRCGEAGGEPAEHQDEEPEDTGDRECPDSELSDRIAAMQSAALIGPLGAGGLWKPTSCWSASKAAPAKAVPKSLRAQLRTQPEPHIDSRHMHAYSRICGCTAQPQRARAEHELQAQAAERTV